MDVILQLLKFYKFDLGDRSISTISQDWSNYDLTWLRSAITESLYRGRYKVISVEQILESWSRHQAIFAKFDLEFESLIWGNSIPSEPAQTQLFNNSVFLSGSLADKANSLEMIEKLKSFCQN
jgi:hypothetical protein